MKKLLLSIMLLTCLSQSQLYAQLPEPDITSDSYKKAAAEVANKCYNVTVSKVASPSAVPSGPNRGVTIFMKGDGLMCRAGSSGPWGTFTFLTTFISGDTYGSYTIYTADAVEEKDDCEEIKNLFDPPVKTCEFKQRIYFNCRDGKNESVCIVYAYVHSSGAVSKEMQYCDPDKEGVEYTCMIYICGAEYGCDYPLTDEKDLPDWKPGGSTGDGKDCQKHITINGDEEAVIDVCGPSGSSGGSGSGSGGGNNGDNDYTDDWTKDCVYKDDNGYYQIKDSDKCKNPGGGNSGGGTGGGTGGGDGDGTDYSGQLGEILGKLDKINETIGKGGGKDYSDQLSEIKNAIKDGKGNGFEGDFGTDSDAEGAVNKGGWGDDQGDYNLDRGESEHKEKLDGLAKNEVITKIKNHSYITTSNATCSVKVVLFKRNFAFSLCEYEKEIRGFGTFLMMVSGLAGLLLILRR